MNRAATDHRAASGRVERVEAAAFEGNSLLLDPLGESTRTAAVEGMLVEGLVTLLNRAELVAKSAGSGPDALASALSHEMAARVALGRRVERLPQTRAAIEAGTLGFESATLLARVASPETEGLWPDRAIISTTKILRESARRGSLAAEAPASVVGRARGGARARAPGPRDRVRWVVGEVERGLGLSWSGLQ